MITQEWVIALTWNFCTYSQSHKEEAYCLGWFPGNWMGYSTGDWLASKEMPPVFSYLPVLLHWGPPSTDSNVIFFTYRKAQFLFLPKLGIVIYAIIYYFSCDGS